jgi:hypothetical protein
MRHFPFAVIAGSGVTGIPAPGGYKVEHYVAAGLAGQGKRKPRRKRMPVTTHQLSVFMMILYC